MLLTFLALGLSLAGANYNEVADQDGALRPAYAATNYYPVAHDLADTLLGSPLDDAIRILPIPLVLTPDEYAFIQKASVQRARTLREFFRDVVFNGGKLARQANLPETFLEKLTVSEAKVELRYLRELWSARRDRAVRFFYGPDLMRAEDGRFRVIEDNTGMIGGVGDLVATHREFARHSSSLPALNYNPLREQIKAFLADIPRERWIEEVIAIYHEPDPNAPVTSSAVEDEESRRKAALLWDLGLRVIAPADLKNPDAIPKGVKKIVCFEDPLGFYNSWIGLGRLMERFARDEITFMVSPGAEILGSKATLPFMDQLTRIYLNEEPLIYTQRTTWVRASDIPKIPTDNGVYKMVGENQGKGVFLVGDLPKANAQFFGRDLEEWQVFVDMRWGEDFPKFVRQDPISSSYLPAELPNSWVKFNVDVRPLVHVNNHVILPPALWGRANMRYRGSKNNVSINAMEMVVTTPEGCEDLLRD